jgi:hypothetical protein
MMQRDLGATERPRQGLNLGRSLRQERGGFRRARGTFRNLAARRASPRPLPRRRFATADSRPRCTTAHWHCKPIDLTGNSPARMPRNRSHRRSCIFAARNRDRAASSHSSRSPRMETCSSKGSAHIRAHRPMVPRGSATRRRRRSRWNRAWRRSHGRPPSSLSRRIPDRPDT